MATLQPVLRALGFSRREQQRAFVKLLHISGAFGALEDVPGMMPDKLADAILEQYDVPSAESAARQVLAATQEHWLLRDGVDRPQFAIHREAILPLLEKLDIAAGANRERMDVGVALDGFARRIHAGFAQLQERVKIEENMREITDGLVMIKPSAIRANGTSKQFRAGADAKGVTETGRAHDTEWSAWKHGDHVIVYQHKNGELDIVDGHHRLDLAQRLEKQGKGPGWLTAKIIREEDGYTEKDAKVIGWIANAAMGHASVIESARMIKEMQSPEVHKELLPPIEARDAARAHLAEAARLSTLGRESLDMVERGEVPVEGALEVASRVHNEAEQTHAMRMVKSLIEQRAASQAVVSAVARVIESRKQESERALYSQ